MTSQKKKYILYAGVLLTAIMFCIPAVYGEMTPQLGTTGTPVPPYQYKPTKIRCTPVLDETGLCLGADLNVTYYSNGQSHTQDMVIVVYAIRPDGFAVMSQFSNQFAWTGQNAPQFWGRLLPGPMISYHIVITEDVDNLPTLVLNFFYPALVPQPPMRQEAPPVQD